MADYNVNMKQWNGSSFDNVLPLAFNSKALEGKSYDDIIQYVQSLIGIDKGKNCLVAWGRYTGNGTYGAANPVSIACGFCPLLVVVKENAAYQYWMLRGCDKFSGANSRENVVAWGDTGVSWYYPKEDKYFPPAGDQLNSSDTVYHYLVLGCDAEN